ncbi:hypothetical protein F5Y04DRAFT_143530 [Hypomontagnella monticulosa]|nr:hypothetical protein F5Y04DRAFT_143530 [Hypomontagnella monticulosa]
MPDPRVASWHNVVLKQKYNDPLKLKATLDGIYGKGQYRVTTRANRYILQLPEKLNEVNEPSVAFVVKAET